MAKVCPGWPHEYDYGPNGCDLDYENYKLESEPGETTMSKRSSNREKFHNGTMITPAKLAQLLTRLAELQAMDNKQLLASSSSSNKGK